MPSKSACLNRAFFTSAAICFERVNVRDLFFRNAQPAKPIAFVRAAPQRSIFLPQPRDLVGLLPIIKRCS